MRLHNKGFYTPLILFVLAETFFIWATYIHYGPPGPFGYAEAETQTLHGKLVYRRGKRLGEKGTSYIEYFFEHTETGKLQKLNSLFIIDSISFKNDKGKVFELTFVKDQILDCRLDGQPRCKMKCACLNARRSKRVT